jgi:hypothetical protein
MTKVERSILWRKNNKARWKENKAKYESSAKGKEARHNQYIDNRIDELARTAEYKRKKLSEDLCYKLKHRIRNRFKMALKNNSKSGSAIQLLGCTIDELKRHLESKFLMGMNWSNYGNNGWHIDHIIPLSKFNLTDIRQLKIVCHYSNLQPLWEKDNLARGKNCG